MKRFGTIPCICTLAMLSSCTLTQQAEPISAEDATTLKQSGDITSKGKDSPQQQSASTDTKVLEAAAEIEKAETAAQQAAESATRPARLPQLMSSRRRPSAEPVKPEPEAQASPEPEEEPAITPTEEQQEAAQKFIEQTAVQEKEPAKVPVRKPQETTPAPQPVVEATPELTVPSGGLRMRRFTPPEEHSDDGSEALPNTVELRGFRSPTMKGKLPMNIDGKIIKED